MDIHSYMYVDSITYLHMRELLSELASNPGHCSPSACSHHYHVQLAPRLLDDLFRSSVIVSNGVAWVTMLGDI